MGPGAEHVELSDLSAQTAAGSQWKQPVPVDASELSHSGSVSVVVPSVIVNSTLSKEPGARHSSPVAPHSPAPHAAHVPGFGADVRKGTLFPETMSEGSSVFSASTASTATPTESPSRMYVYVNSSEPPGAIESKRNTRLMPMSPRLGLLNE